MKKPFKDSKASWYDDFVRNRKIITVHLHILHPAIRSNRVRKPVKKRKKMEEKRAKMDKESSRSNFWSKKTFVLVKIMNDMEFVDRNILGICKDHLNYITMADCKHFRGDAIDLETFSGNIISGIVFTKRRKLLIFKFTECEKTEETLMTSWYPAVTAVFNDKTITKVWSFFIRSM